MPLDERPFDYPEPSDDVPVVASYDDEFNAEWPRNIDGQGNVWPFDMIEIGWGADTEVEEVEAWLEEHNLTVEEFKASRLFLDALREHEWDWLRRI